MAMYTKSSKDKYNEIYSNANSLSKSASLSIIPKHADKIMDNFKKDKLVGLLMHKYIKILNIESEGDDMHVRLSKEIAKSIKKETIGEEDLKRLEVRLKSMFKPSVSKRSISLNSLNEGNMQTQIETKPTKLPPIKKELDLDEEAEQAYKDYNDFLKTQKKNPVSSRNFFASDEWGAVIKYEKNKFDKEKQNIKHKENENIRKWQNQINNQIKVHVSEQNKELLEKKELFNRIMEDVDSYNKSENDKVTKMKIKILKENTMLTKQLIEEKNRKKITKQKEIMKDKQYVKEMLQLVEKDKEEQIRKKEKAREAYLVIIKENEERKILLEEQNRKERERDIQAIQEYSDELDRLEKARKDYFKNNSVKMLKFGGNMIEKVLKVENEKRASEDANTQRCFNIRQEMLQKREDDNKQKLRDQKVLMRKYLDIQMEERKKDDESEQKDNIRQRNLFKQDVESYEKEQREKNEKVSINSLSLYLFIYI